MKDDFRVDPELFRKDGWSRKTLLKHLGWRFDSLKRQLKKAGLSLDAKPNHNLNDRDVETILTLYLKRRAERLYGGAPRAKRTP